MKLLLERRRRLRRGSTDAEVVLWKHLRARQLESFKFRRQHPFGPFILDFYCAEARLAVELDGGQHFEPAAQIYDERRSTFLRRRGIRVLRFPTNHVFQQLGLVLESIAIALRDGPSP